MIAGIEYSVRKISLKKIKTIFLRRRLSGLYKLYCFVSCLFSMAPSCLLICSYTLPFYPFEQLKQGKFIYSFIPKCFNSYSLPQFLYFLFILLPFLSLSSNYRRPSLYTLHFDCFPLFSDILLPLMGDSCYLPLCFSRFFNIEGSGIVSSWRKSKVWSSLAISSKVFLMTCLAYDFTSDLYTNYLRRRLGIPSSWKSTSK